MGDITSLRQQMWGQVSNLPLGYEDLGMGLFARRIVASAATGWVAGSARPVWIRSAFGSATAFSTFCHLLLLSTSFSPLGCGNR